MNLGSKEAKGITDGTTEREITSETGETTEKEIILGTVATTIGFAINATTLILALEQNVIGVAVKKIQAAILGEAEMIQGEGAMIGVVSPEIIAQETIKRSMIMIGIVRNATIQTSHLEKNVIVVVSQGRITLEAGTILETGTGSEIMPANLEKSDNLGSLEARVPGMLTIEVPSH